MTFQLFLPTRRFLNVDKIRCRLVPPPPLLWDSHLNSSNFFFSTKVNNTFNNTPLFFLKTKDSKSVLGYYEDVTWLKVIKLSYRFEFLKGITWSFWIIVKYRGKKKKKNERRNEMLHYNREMKRVSAIFYLNHDFRFSGRRTINHFHRR